MSGHTERDFETANESRLTGPGGYETRSPDAGDETLALFPADVTGVLGISQSTRWQVLKALLGLRTAAPVPEGLSKELERGGTQNSADIETATAAHLSIAPRHAFASTRVLAPTVWMGNISK